MSRYIANGTEGELWMEENCNRCAKDHEQHDEGDGGPGCELVLGLMVDEFPLEGLVVHAGEFMPKRLKCTFFEPCSGCGVPADYRPSSWGVGS